MEIAFCQSCQIIRRGGKRVVSQVDKAARTQSNLNIPYNGSIRPQFLKFNIGIRRFDHIFNTIPSLLTGNNLMQKKILRNKPFWASGTYRNLHTVNKNSLVTSSEIEEVLDSGELPFTKGYTGYLTSCNQCIGDNSVQESNLSTFIDMQTGDSICVSCGVKYDWKTLKAKITIANDNGKDIEHQPITYEAGRQNPLEHQQWLNSQLISEISKLKLESYFPLKHISTTMLEKYHIRCTNDSGILFPYYDITRQNVIGFKLCECNSNPVVVKEDYFLSLFGWHLIKPSDTCVVLTTNELDSIVVTMATGTPSLSLPCGGSALPPSYLPFLEQFKEIILWFGGEHRARENLQHFAKKLSLSRCSQVTSNNGASFVLCESGEENVQQCLLECRSMSHDHIVSFKELRTEILTSLINAEENAGIPFTRFPILNDYLKGHRRGELTVLTGPTGCGKTTFLSELSLDLCMQGVKTLWGSFEIKNSRLANIMIHQYAGIELAKHINMFPDWTEEFENLPMYYMNYYGPQDLGEVLKTIEYAIYTYDIEHIVIDNLQFMVHIEKGHDRFQAMDEVLASFRKCASEHNVHVTIVIHPRKEEYGSALTTSSIYGSAKPSQEADNVMILQAIVEDDVLIQVSKNRFSGTVGVVPLSFNPTSLCLSGFYRRADTGEQILPTLKPKKIIRNLKVEVKTKT